MFKFTEEAIQAISNDIQHARENIKNVSVNINSTDLDMFLVEVEDEIKFRAIQLSRGRKASTVEKLDIDNALKKLEIELFRNQKMFSLHHNQILGDMRVLKKRLESSKIPLVLDAGCGWGRFSRRLNKYLEKRTEIVGIDLDFPSLQYGKSLSYDAHFVRAHMKYLPFKDKVFDAALSSKALHEIENENDRSKTVDEFARTLKQEGTIYIHDLFARFYLVKLIRRLLHTVFSTVEWYSQTSEFEKNLKTNGFKIIRRNYTVWPVLSLSTFGSYIAVKK